MGDHLEISVVGYSGSVTDKEIVELSSNSSYIQLRATDSGKESNPTLLFQLWVN